MRACRADTPQAFRTLAADGLGKAFDADAAVLRISTVGIDGNVQVTAPTVATVECHWLGEWDVTIDADLRRHLIAQRAQRLPNETGGSLLGIIDAQALTIHVVDVVPAPPDSIETSREFERGIAGLSEMVETRMRRVMEQVRYVGEWHSHPLHASTAPSSLDLPQLAWTSAVLAAEDSPALSLIVGDAGLNVMVGSALSLVDADAATRIAAL